MKKLSLKNAKNLLSRKEMKTISGGYGGYGGSICARATSPSGETQMFCSDSYSLTHSWAYVWQGFGWSIEYFNYV